MKAFEEGLPLKEKVAYAEPFVGKNPEWIAWMRDAFWSLMGKPGPYDYIARVCIARKRFAAIDAKHRSAAKVNLEQIVANLAPNPDDLLACSGKNSDHDSIGVAPLNDEIFKGVSPRIISMRYEILAKAFVMYVDTSMKMMSQDLEEEKEGAFVAEFRNFQEQLKEPLERMVEGRRKLYKDFPEEDLRSVHDRTLRIEKDLLENEDERDPQTVKRQITGAERFITTILQAIMQKAREEIDRLQQKQEAYMARINPLYALCQVLSEYLEEECKEDLEKMFKEYAKAVEERFAPKNVLPAEVYQDFQSSLTMYRGGIL